MDDSAGDNVDQYAEAADDQTQTGPRIQQDESHLEPTRWWFASSAFPMIAGTLGPTASAFSICALVRPWRQRLAPGGDVETAPFMADPPWLTIVNAIQLVVALVSNVFLLLNMTRRIRFTVAQPVTIIGWYISAILLLSLTASAAGPLLEHFNYPLSELIWSQAFYYGMWAAILYFVDASLMVITYYGARTGRYSKDFELTTSQRTLMLQTIMFLSYLLIGALVFSKIEGWNYLDGIYWADVTLFTVGFGDYTVSTTLGKALIMPYSLIGIITLGLVIGSIRSMILERGKRRMDARMEEKKRHQVVKKMVRRGTDSVLRPISTNDKADVADDLRTFELNQTSKPMKGRMPTNELERRKEEFQLMRSIQRKAATRRRWAALCISASCWLVLWLLGAYVFMICEQPYQNWSYFEAVYFCFISLVTIGYGDKSPKSNGGKSFFVFWSLLALPTMTVLISNAGDTVVKFIKDATLRLGNITILPGEHGFSDDIKHIVHQATNGRLGSRQNLEDGSTSWTHWTAPRLRNVHTYLFTKDRAKSGHQHEKHEDCSSSASQKSRFPVPKKEDHPPPHRNQPLPDPLHGPEFHYILASEISIVTQHLCQGSRRYSFEEWAWFLKLIGEDERNPETHRGPPSGQPSRRTRREKTTESRTNDGDQKWSWVDHQSPLMGSKEESEWILEHLTYRLKDSLLQGQGKTLEGDEPM